MGEACNAASPRPEEVDSNPEGQGDGSVVVLEAVGADLDGEEAHTA
jgi:hypothetical protein